LPAKSKTIVKFFSGDLGTWGPGNWYPALTNQKPVAYFFYINELPATVFAKEFPFQVPWFCFRPEASGLGMDVIL
jgi:hypothetical protein